MSDQPDIYSLLCRIFEEQVQQGSRIDRLEAGQVRMRADIMERIDRLQNAVTAIRDDIAVSTGGADASGRWPTTPGKS